MNLYDARSPIEMYRIIKANYEPLTNLKMTKLPNMTKIYDHFHTELSKANSLDFSFATNYLKKCKSAYNIQHGNVQFYILTASIVKSKKHIFDVFNRVHTVMELYHMKKPLTFYILLNPSKRYMPKPNTIIEPKHINGGYTYTNGNNIYIIRKEDYEKVIIHELLHHNKILHFDDWKQSNINKLKHHFNIHKNCDLYPNEAVIETLACIIHVAFKSIELNQKFSTLLKREINHSLVLHKKIKDYQNGKIWYETTNAFAYVVFRTILLYYCKQFMSSFKSGKYDQNYITNLLIKYSKNVEKKTYDLTYINRGLSLII